MQLQNTPETYLFKIWPWIEANKIRLAWGGGIAIVAVGAIWFYSAQQEQKQIDAGQALTQLVLTDPHNNPPQQQADAFLGVARKYQKTAAGERAYMQSAALLFAAGKYTDAQTRFQEFLGEYPSSFFAAQAALGVASSLDALGKTDQAAGAYQKLIATYSDVMAQNLARFGLAQIDEHQNKLTEALNIYGDIVRAMPGSQLSSEAQMRAMELKMKQPAASPAATAPAVSSKPNP
jgi:TolA-binding protein